MTDIDKLIAIEEIKKLKARYFHCIDLKDFNSLCRVFTQDATYDVRQALKDPITQPDEALQGEFVEVLEGCAEIINVVKSVMIDTCSIHHGSMPEIEILSATHAKGIWAMEDIVITPDIHLHGYGHYHETYKKVDGHWLIESLILTRLKVDVITLN